MADVFTTLDNISTEFFRIGEKRGTQLKLHGDDTTLIDSVALGPKKPFRDAAVAALEFACSDRLCRLAADRKDRALQQGLTTGLFRDLKSYPVGDTIAFSNKDFMIRVKEDEPSEIIDRERLEAELIFAMGPTKAANIIKKCLKPRDGNTTITVLFRQPK